MFCGWEDNATPVISIKYGTNEQCPKVKSSCLDQTLKHGLDVLCVLTKEGERERRERESTWVQPEDEPKHLGAEKWLLDQSRCPKGKGIFSLLHRYKNLMVWSVQRLHAVAASTFLHWAMLENCQM
ncbi:hypothetical protein Tco_0758852 [Tanacetum coccineum]